jgi:hypothetical protein
MNTKCMAFIACSLMMSMTVQTMEIENPQARIFLWSSQDREYHVVTECGEISEIILEKSEQERKVSKARLVIEKNEECEIGTRYLSIDTHKYGQYNTSYGSAAYGLYQRTQIPISFSPEQYKIMLDGCGDSQKEAVLVMYDDNNVYSITDICNNIHAQLEPVNIFGDNSSESSSASRYAYYRQVANQTMTVIAWGAAFAVLISLLNSPAH